MACVGLDLQILRVLLFYPIKYIIDIMYYTIITPIYDCMLQKIGVNVCLFTLYFIYFIVLGSF